MAGRNVSVSHVALSSTRVMATCAMLGQAVGTGAAYCLNNGILPTKLGNDSSHMGRFQQQLLRQDQGMLGVKNEDDQDLVKQATVRASAETNVGAAVNILDGTNRDIMDGTSHQWQAEMNGGEPWLEISWSKPVKISKVQLTFDTGSHRRLMLSGDDSVYNSQQRGPQPETIADYVVEAKTKSGTQILAKIENNFLRRVEHQFRPIEVESIRIKVRRTNGDILARIFEVRGYMEEVREV
jgi:hypothetical protein